MNELLEKSMLCLNLAIEASNHENYGEACYNLGAADAYRFCLFVKYLYDAMEKEEYRDLYAKTISTLAENDVAHGRL